MSGEIKLSDRESNAHIREDREAERDWENVWDEESKKCEEDDDYYCLDDDDERGHIQVKCKSKGNWTVIASLLYECLHGSGYEATHYFKTFTEAAEYIRLIRGTNDSANPVIIKYDSHEIVHWEEAENIPLTWTEFKDRFKEKINLLNQQYPNLKL